MSTPASPLDNSHHDSPDDRIGNRGEQGEDPFGALLRGGHLGSGLLGALRLAREHCRPDCFAYHVCWPAFRRAGLKGHPGWHVGFYQRVLAQHPLPTHRKVRVLICAASDQAMLATLARVLGRDRIRAHMIDTCRTPLIRAAAYARRRGIELTTAHASAPELDGVSGPVDLAVSDGLLSLLPESTDADLLAARLAALLTAGGLVLYTTRIAGPTGRLEYDRLGRLTQAATAWLAWPAPPPERHALARRIHARPARVHPFTTPARLADVFTPQFTTVRLFTRTAAPSWPLRVHPAIRAGAGSYCVGVAAHCPRRSPTP